MKLPSSSYSSPSSCSAASYHLNSDAAAAAGCFSGILRRLVCNTLDVGSSSSSSSRSRVADAGSDGGAVLQTAAAAEAPEKDHGISLKPPAPGIVARLMGLDSMPELPSAHPIGRSRSTGSLVLLPVPSTSHRRSHSFREAPTFLRPENDEFLLLSFSPENNGDETKKSPQPPPTPANHSMGLRQLDQSDAVEEETRERPSQTQRSAEKTTPTKQQQQKKKKKTTTTNAQRKTRERPSQTQRSAEKTPTKQQQQKKKTNAQRKTSREKTTTHREAPERTRPTKKKKSSVGPKTMAAELDGSSQNSSPVSVLDRRLPELDGESFTDTSTPISDEEEEEEPRPEGSPRRKLSSPVDCFDDPSQFFHLILVDYKEGSISMATTDQERRGAAASLPPSSSHLWTEASRLAVGDAQRQPWKVQDPEELVAEYCNSTLFEGVYPKFLNKTLREKGADGIPNFSLSSIFYPTWYQSRRCWEEHRSRRSRESSAADRLRRLRPEPARASAVPGACAPAGRPGRSHLTNRLPDAHRSPRPCLMCICLAQRLSACRPIGA